MIYNDIFIIILFQRLLQTGSLGHAFRKKIIRHHNYNLFTTWLHVPKAINSACYIFVNNKVLYSANNLKQENCIFFLKNNFELLESWGNTEVI